MSGQHLKSIQSVITSLNQRAPLGTSEIWDNVGLLLGDPAAQTSGAVVSIDLTQESIDLAVEKGYSLIINHHPCIFPKSKGLSQVVAGTLLYEALRRGIAVASYHTNFDQCALEVVEAISGGLGIEPMGRFVEKPAENQVSGKTGLVSGLGYGFWGHFPSPKAFSEVAKGVKSLFSIHGFWITNPPPSSITRVGFVAGKGASFVEAALSSGCDLFITGEAGYHTALGAMRRGMAVMEIGHRESEKFFIQTMKNWLLQLGLEVVEGQSPTQCLSSGGI